MTQINPTLRTSRQRMFFSAISVFSFALGSSALDAEFVSENYDPGLYAEMKTTKGDIILELEYEKTPMTVANFAGLATGKKDSNKPEGTKFYDGVVFHRVIDNFMVQGGDPEGSGRGGPGYDFPDEIHPELKHDSGGILSMANAGPGTNGSQFFITHKETPWLDGKHTVFGQVVEGMDVVNAIEKGDTIETINIHAVGEDAQGFTYDQASFEEYKKDITEKDIRLIEKKYPDLTVSPTGLRYKVLTKPEEGAPSPEAGDTISAHYSGTFLDGGKFDSSYDRGKPIEFPVGKGYVIRGWDEALVDMQVGEKRLLVIPPDLAYGPRGRGPIPPNAWLVFEVELLGVK